jgi:hypothetical protein
MINSETPYKWAEILTDTWPHLYRPPQMPYNREKQNQNERVLDRKRK